MKEKKKKSKSFVPLRRKLKNQVKPSQGQYANLEAPSPALFVIESG